MAYKRVLKIILPLVFLVAAVDSGVSQNRNYEIVPAPDLWYNDVDGIRAGVNLKGQVPGTFDDGPHRLNLGVWLSTWFPPTPVSYYVRYTNPISEWSDFGSEAAYSALSSIRTGYHRHGAGFSKRWQTGFDERNFTETGIMVTYEDRFDDEYTPFPALWTGRDKILTSLFAHRQNENTIGFYSLKAEVIFQIRSDAYSQLQVELLQQLPVSTNFGFKFRAYAGIASSDTDREYLFSRSTSPAIEWLESGLTRAKGTVPHRWMRSGDVHIAGGANLRGYTNQDIRSFRSNPFLVTSIGSLNAEMDYPNPLGKLFDSIPFVSDFFTFRSYLFYDAGTSLGLTSRETDNVYADTGGGFSLSLNIPDPQGKPRGFVFSYEIPYWLSEPGLEDEFKFRSLFSIGAVITL